MLTTLFILLQAEGASEASDVVQSFSIDWTVAGIILAAIPIIGLLVTMIYRLGRFRQRFDTMDNTINSFGSEIKTIGQSVGKNTVVLKSVTTVLRLKFRDMDGLFESNSPVSLSDIGEAALVESGGKEYIDNNLNALLLEMEEEDLETALDVQDFSTSLLILKTEDKEFNKIKTFVYNNPVYKGISISIVQIVKVMAIYLRDKYLEKHPNLLADEEL